MPERVLLRKLDEKFLELQKRHFLPFVQTMRPNGEIYSQKTNHTYFENFLSLSCWQRMMQINAKKLVEWNKGKHERHIFFDSYGQVYCLREILSSEGVTGFVVFGGYLSENISELLEMEIPIFTKNEIEVSFEEINKELTKFFQDFSVSFPLIVATLKSDFSHKYTLDELSDLHYCSKNKIKELFQEHAKESFGKFYLRLRMEYAYDRLKATSCTLEEVAGKVGYQDTRSFRRAFNSYFRKR